MLKKSLQWKSLVLFAGLLALGVLLRIFQINHQILLDDDWHAIIKLATSDYRSIASSFGVTDHSIPLTLLFKWLSEHGVLSEAAMLALPFAFGTAAPILLVVAARRSMSTLALSLFGGLMAISPLLVLYARQARPYAITLSLALIAIWAVYKWMEKPRLSYAAIYSVSGVLAVYCHVIVAPVVFGVWVWFLVERVQERRGDWPNTLKQLMLGVLTLGITALLVGPPLASDLISLASKAGADHATGESAFRAVMMMLGSGSIVFTIIMLGLAALGLTVSYKRLRRPTLFIGFLLAVQVLAVLVSGALWISQQMVLARYLLICLPFLLYVLAIGLECVIQKLSGGRAVFAFVAAGAFLATSFVLGPLPNALRYPNAFFAHQMYFHDFDESHNVLIPYLRDGPIPEFYRTLGRRPRGELTIIEGPWRFESMFNRLPLFQRVHGQHVRIGLVGGLCPPGAYGEQSRFFRNKFRHFVDLAQPVEQLRQQGDFLVLHRKLELANMTGPSQSYNGLGLPPMEACAIELSRRLGKPVFEDDVITVFGLHQ